MTFVGFNRAALLAVLLGVLGHATLVRLAPTTINHTTDAFSFFFVQSKIRGVFMKLGSSRFLGFAAATR